jgi:hypothetical protein
MSVDVILIDQGTGRKLHTVNSNVGKSHGPILVVETAARAHASWNAVTVTSASTTVVAQPLTNGGIIITDIVLSAKKKTASTVKVQFTDGSNTEVLIAPDIVNSPANISWSPQGLIKGWKDARVELVTDATFDCTLTLGYIKTLGEPAFAVWDAER